MKISTTELLGIIVREMSSENIEITNVDIYEAAVKINNKVKVLITNDGYIVHRVNEGGGLEWKCIESMVDKVLELLKSPFKKGDYITEGVWSGTLIYVDDDEYIVVDLEENETVFHSPRSLENLYALGWRKG